MKLSLVTVPAGSEVYIGAPANPLPIDFTHTLAQKLSEIPNLLEAHIPQCYLKGVIDDPAQVLVLVAKKHNLEPILNSVEELLSGLLNADATLDIWPIDKSNKLVSVIREADCKLFDARPSKRFSIF